MKIRTMGSEKGFTMIELIMVIVILGILAAVAVPKFVNMKTEAAVSQADGVYAAAQSAAAVNFSGNMLGKGLTAVTTGATLLGAMDGTPTGWAVDGGDAQCISSTISGVTYKVCVTAPGETSSVKATITKSW